MTTEIQETLPQSQFMVMKTIALRTHHHRQGQRQDFVAHRPRLTQRKPMWPVEVSTASSWRAAGR